MTRCQYTNVAQQVHSQVVNPKSNPRNSNFSTICTRNAVSCILLRGEKQYRTWRRQIVERIRREIKGKGPHTR
eukprot:1571988-Rhodomonas_salina.2